MSNKETHIIDLEQDLGNSEFAQELLELGSLGYKYAYEQETLLVLSKVELTPEEAEETAEEYEL